MYKALVTFLDAEHQHVYRAGDAYPLPGYSADSKRLALLKTDKNRLQMRLIEEVKGNTPAAKTRRKSAKKAD